MIPGSIWEASYLMMAHVWRWIYMRCHYNMGNWNYVICIRAGVGSSRPKSTKNTLEHSINLSLLSKVPSQLLERPDVSLFNTITSTQKSSWWSANRIMKIRIPYIAPISFFGCRIPSHSESNSFGRFHYHQQPPAVERPDTSLSLVRSALH
jgi:hypothetical protein